MYVLAFCHVSSVISTLFKVLISHEQPTRSKLYLSETLFIGMTLYVMVTFPQLPVSLYVLYVPNNEGALHAAPLFAVEMPVVLSTSIVYAKLANVFPQESVPENDPVYET